MSIVARRTSYCALFVAGPILFRIDLRLLGGLIELGLRLAKLRLFVLQRPAQRDGLEVRDDVAALDGGAVGRQLEDLQLAGLKRRRHDDGSERPDVAARFDDLDEIAARHGGRRHVRSTATLQRVEAGGGDPHAEAGRQHGQDAETPP